MFFASLLGTMHCSAFECVNAKRKEIVDEMVCFLFFISLVFVESNGEGSSGNILVVASGTDDFVIGV